MVIQEWPTISADRAAEYQATGAWRGLTMAQFLAQRVSETPDRICLVDDIGQYSYADLDASARKLAGWLSARGLRQGDVVAFQLPNWHEAAEIALACSLLGLVCLPIVPIYREAEVRFILQASQARVFFVPQVFRGFDHGAMALRLVREIPTLETSCLVRGAGEDPYAVTPWSGEALGRADEPALLMYTSGTTGRAKGVVHSANSLDCELCHVTRFWKLLPDRDMTLMASPVTHVTGFLYGLMMPVTHGIPAVLMERWDAADAVRLVEEKNVTFTVSATPFLRELLDAAQEARNDLTSLRIFACGGAPVPPDLIRRAWESFPSLVACRVYGSTEAPTVSLGVASRETIEHAAETDGRIVGHDVRIVSEEGRVLAPGEEGEIVTRGPEMFTGYLDPTDNAAAFDQEGYFRTGDLGYVTSEGCIVITGRKKDLIIRGGENLSAKEIEDMLHRHPAIHEAAVVAMPHERLGETCCAYLVADGSELDVSALSTFLTTQGLARQKHPEKLVFLKEMPRTASGKIQKYVLRDQLIRKSP